MSKNSKESYTTNTFGEISKQQLYDFIKENKIKMNIRINVDAETIYEYAYLLMDFQSLFNGIYKLIDDANNPKRKISIEWNLPSREFNKKYQNQLVLNSLSKGSVFVDISTNVLSGLLTRYIEESVYKKVGNNANVHNKPMNTTVVHNQYICLPNKQIDQGSLFQKAICTRVERGRKIHALDVNKYYDEIIKKAELGQNTEENIKRFYKVLEEEGLVPKGAVYDSKGIKKICYDMDNFIGTRFDGKA